MFYAFYYNNLFPEQMFLILRSIEIILGPIIGGVGTLFGPILGAFLLTGLAEVLAAKRWRRSASISPGAKRVFYGVCLLVVMMVLPDGIWPPLARLLRLGKLGDTPDRRHDTRSCTSHGISKSFSGLRAVDRGQLRRAAGRDLRRHRSERRRQDHACST